MHSLDRFEEKILNKLVDLLNFVSDSRRMIIFLICQ